MLKTQQNSTHLAGDQKAKLNSRSFAPADHLGRRRWPQALVRHAGATADHNRNALNAERHVPPSDGGDAADNRADRCDAAPMIHGTY